ncbi:MAG: efflux RND transporter periplasmic adaptor subunit [Vicinamibacteria bacterium]|jgi:HlyD family secretion protein|nr:efflux RND transporter periplasmic adaptor subunit [Vicinamibacteria bacterium]MBP9945262.1 efflux RND transporter periplasmic adaptor subunit [Vicinamibacteria bacterium]
MRKIVIVLAVLVVGGLGAVAYSKSVKSADPGFKTVLVTRGEVVEKALAVGAIRPDQEISVKSKISGIVRRSYREVGDYVRAGEPLFEIQPDPTPLELTEARREVENAMNAYDQAKRRYDRQDSLKNQGITSSQDWDTAQKELQETESRLGLAREKLALVEKGRIKSERLNVESVIRAPVSGTVLELAVHEGDPVVPLTSFQAGTPLAVMADMGTLLFKGTVDEIDVGKLTEGLPAKIKIGALPEAVVEGRLSKISPKSKTSEGATLFDVEIDITAAKGVVLRAGYSANADIVVKEKKDVLLVPERLVKFEGGKATVEVPAGLGKEPEKKEIKYGLSDGMNVEVTDGLKEKDEVVERPPKKIE